MHYGPEAYRLQQQQVKQQQKLYGGARRAPQFDTPIENLRRLLKATPLTVDLEELQDALTTAEQANVPAFELKKGIAKLEYSERVQTAARIKKLAAEVQAILFMDDLDVDVEKLLEAIEFAEGKPGVPEGLIEKAEAKLQSAEDAQERRRQELKAAATAKIMKLAHGPVMLLDAQALVDAQKEGDECGVDHDVHTLVHEKVRAAARRDAAIGNLNFFATSEPFELDAAAMRAAMKEAMEAGAPMALVKEAQLVLRQAELAQVRARNAAPATQKTRADILVWARGGPPSRAVSAVFCRPPPRPFGPLLMPWVSAVLTATSPSHFAPAGLPLSSALAPGTRAAFGVLLSISPPPSLSLSLSLLLSLFLSLSLSPSLLPLVRPFLVRARSPMLPPQAGKNTATKLLKTLTDKPPLEIEIDPATKALEEATAAMVAAEDLMAAKAKLAAAAAEQEKRDSAAATMVLAAAPEEFSVSAIKKTVEAAKAAGVREHVIECCEAKCDGDERRTKAEIKAMAAKRAMEHQKKMAKADANAQMALNEARKDVQHLKDKAEVTLQAALAQVKVACSADAKMLKAMGLEHDADHLLIEHLMEHEGDHKAAEHVHTPLDFLEDINEEEEGEEGLEDTEPLGDVHEMSKEEEDDEHDYLKEVRQSAAGPRGSLSAPPPTTTPAAKEATTPEELWEASVEERVKAVEAEGKATAAWAAFEEAVHQEHVAQRYALVASKEADWANKEAAAYGEAERRNAEKLAAANLQKAKDLAALKPKIAPPEVQKQVRKEGGAPAPAKSGGGGGGGCCGGKKQLNDVLEVDVIDVQQKPSPPSAPPSPPPSPPNEPVIMDQPGDTVHGLDGLSWSPLWCARAANKVDLLKGLALEGSYTDETVCEAVAKALAAVDPQCATGFVRELSQQLPSLPSAKAATLGMVADTWLSKVVLDLIEKSGTMVTAGETVSLVVESVAYVFKKTLRSLLETHYEYTNAVRDVAAVATSTGAQIAGGASRLSLADVAHGPATDIGEIDMATKAKISDLHSCIAHMLGSSMHSHERFMAMLPIWAESDPEGAKKADPPAALADTAVHFSQRVFTKQSSYRSRRDKKALTPEDKADERVVLAMIGLFVKQPERLVGIQQLVPKVFDCYLAKSTALRDELCMMLSKGGMPSDLVERIRTDDKLVAQPFFWSSAGMKLFGGGKDLHDEAKLRKLLNGALEQQPAIVLAWLQQIIGQITAQAKSGQEPTADGELGMYMKTVIIALGDYVQSVGIVKHSADPDPSVNECVGILLEMATKYRAAVYEAVLAGCVATAEAPILIDAFAANFRSHIGIAAHDTRIGHHDIVHTKVDEKGHARLSRISMAGKGHHHAQHHEHGPGSHPPSALKSQASRVSAVTGGGRLSLVKTPDEDAPADEDAPQDTRMSKLMDVHNKLGGVGGIKVPDVPSPNAPAGSRTSMAGSRTSMAGGLGALRTSMAAEQPKMSATERLAATRASRASAAGIAEKKKMSIDPVRDEMIIMTLASLFVAAPAQITAFAQLVPKVLETKLALGTPAREKLNNMMMSGKDAFLPELEHLLCKTDELMGAPFFWHADVVPLCTSKRIEKSYPTLNQATLVGKDGSKIHLYSRLLALLLRLSSAGANSEPAEIARRTVEVLDQFERNVDQQQFIMTIFNNLEERTKASPELFADFKLTVFSEVAANGVQTISSVQGDGMELCEQAMTTLLKGYLANEEPSKWKKLFKEATNIGFMVKYMFRENLQMAKDQFMEFCTNGNNFRKMPNAKEVQKLLTTLVDLTLRQYGEVGIFDPEKLAEIDFLNQPQLLVDLVSASKSRESRAGKEDMQLLTTVTTKWMEFMIEKKFPPLTPHHTQAFIVMMMARFFGDYLDPTLDPKIKAKNMPGKLKLKAFVAQMSTGEGKSIVIAMCSIFMVKLYGLKVHVLENNEGLLERDYATNAPFYERFGIKSGKDLADKDAQIIYTLKAGINKHFLRGMVAGELELDKTVLIVDEVDDLIVNERPNAHYVKVDVEKTPALVKSLAAIKLGEGKPADVDDSIWQKASRDMAIAEAREEGKHYRVIVDAEGKKTVIQLNSDGQVPKVPLTSPWLKALQYKLCGLEPTSDSHFACVCTPFVFNMYAGIFGLTGSVGGKAELGYLTKTYSAVKFDAPRFLDTCKGNARKVVLNHGVELIDGPEKQIERVVELCHEYYRRVPVLVIAASPEELTTIVNAVKGAGKVPADEVQRFSEFDENGASLKSEWQTVIDDATKRIGGQEDNRCRVTVTDRFGGRGHDFQVVDKEANANGGMLVIATSVPDEREWIQWKGRTARQDRPGQFYVILDKKSKALQKPGLLAKVQGLKKDGKPDHDARVELLLENADEGIGDKLIAFEKEQAAGEKLNEVSVKYFKKNPRDFDDAWPQLESDKALRHFMTTMIEASPEEIKKEAKKQLGLELD